MLWCKGVLSEGEQACRQHCFRTVVCEADCTVVHMAAKRNGMCMASEACFNKPMCIACFSKPVCIALHAAGIYNVIQSACMHYYSMCMYLVMSLMSAPASEEILPSTVASPACVAILYSL
jgi:hypothetical protein